jgi:hypothetical protein
MSLPVTSALSPTIKAAPDNSANSHMIAKDTAAIESNLLQGLVSVRYPVGKRTTSTLGLTNTIEHRIIKRNSTT